jgi:hypothetical protein
MKNQRWGLIFILIVFTCCVAVGCYEDSMTEPDRQESRGFGGTMQKPVKIVIPKIGVDAVIQPGDIDKDGNVTGQSQGTGVIWYEKGASPGWDSNAILTAHNHLMGTPGALRDLEKLVIGDIVEFSYEDGSIGRFVVKSTHTYSWEDEVPASVQENSGPTRTTLIIGTGDLLPSGKYSHCFVVTLVATEHIGIDGQKI